MRLRHIQFIALTKPIILKALLLQTLNLIPCPPLQRISHLPLPRMLRVILLLYTQNSVLGRFYLAGLLAYLVRATRPRLYQPLLLF